MYIGHELDLTWGDSGSFNIVMVKGQMNKSEYSNDSREEDKRVVILESNE